MYNMHIDRYLRDGGRERENRENILKYTPENSFCWRPQWDKGERRDRLTFINYLGKTSIIFFSALTTKVRVPPPPLRA